MGRTFRYLFAMLWGAVPALALFFLLRPLRLRRLEGKGLSSPARREVALALFWMFCGGAALLGLTPRWVVPALAGLPLGMPWNQAGLPFFSPGTVSLVPFLTFSYSAYILAANVGLFLPFGLFPALLFRGFGWRRALAAGGCITLLIETCQLFIGRTFDVDDLMLNTLGVFCGFLLGGTVRRLFPRFAAGFAVRTALQDGGRNRDRQNDLS